MPSNTKEQKRGSKPPKHWTQNVQYSTVSWADDGRLHFSVKGGAENGQFVFISDVKQDRVVIRSGKVHVDEILLEVNDMKVAGFTLWDIDTLFREYKDQLLHLKSVKTGQSLTKDLRKFLNIRFQKGSVDHELQQTIRENLYYRTVPCTTRPPRDGEIDGVDYKFLSANEFMALEKSGHLLESGIFDGNHYGTPKPPKSPPPDSLPGSPLREQPRSPTEESSMGESNETENDSREDVIRSAATPSSAGKRQRNKSTIDATTSGSSNAVDTGTEEDRSKRVQELEDKYGPLGSNWEISFTEDGDMYYIDHENEVTQWHDPREPVKEDEEEEEEVTKKSESDDTQSEDLPHGWEKIEDPQYGTYYIDHVNRKTQYECPVLPARVNGERSEPVKEEGMEASEERGVESSKPPGGIKENGGTPQITTAEEWHHLFTGDPEMLEGTRLKTSLFKSRQGFGFTIIGGDEPDEFLQIKSILPDGPAFEDGKLETGDVLVYVNDTKVLGTTHQQVVSLFQTIPPGEKVTLDVCRGYPLPFDPNDPNTNIITTYAVEPPKSPSGDSGGAVVGPSPLPARRPPVRSASVEHFPNHLDGIEPGERPHVDGRRHGPRRKAEHDLKRAHARSLPDLTQEGQMEDRPASKPETIVVELLKGPEGFGFTLADSPYGQKIKQVLAPERCRGLQKGDILVEVNSDPIQRWPHAEVVKRLKECPQGAVAKIVVHRGGYMRPSRNAPHSPQRNYHGGGPHSPNGTRYPDERGDHRHPPPDRRGYRHQNGREPFQRHADQRRSEPPPRSNDSGQMPNHVLPPPMRVESYPGERGPPGGDHNADTHSLGAVSLDSHQRRMYYPDRAQPPHPSEQNHRSNEKLIRPLSQGQLHASPPPGRDAQSHFIESTIFLKKGEKGFGFKIIGGIEEGTQVTVGYIVEKGAADLDGRLRSGDQILYIDGQPVSNASHSKVVTLMNNAGHIGRVSLGIRRIVPLAPRESTSPSHSRSSLSTIVTSPVDAHSTEVVLTRHDSEGFGFVVISSHLKSGTSIGRITKGSPADRNGWLKIGDHIIAINGIDITNMQHRDIVNLIKDTGLTVSLTVGAREGDPLSQRSPPSKGERDFTSAQAMPAQVKLMDSVPSPLSQSPRHTLQQNHKPPEPIYAQSSKMRPLNSQPPAGAQQTPIGGHPAPQGSMNNLSRSAFEDPRAARSNQLPPYTRPPTLPPSSPSKTLPRSMEPLRRDQAPLSHTDGPMQRPLNASMDHLAPRRVPTDPRAATLGRIPQGRYPPPNREVGFRPAEGNPMNRLPPGQRTPPGQITPPGQRTPPRGPQVPYQRDEAGQLYSVEIERGQTGFGFSLRGGKEYNTPFYVLRMAENGPAARQGVMRIGDQLLKINNTSTEGMTHKDAIDVIRTGGNRVALTLQRARPPMNDARRTAQTPPPMFHNAPLRHSNVSLQNHQPRQQDIPPQTLDTNWTYRSLPRNIRH